MTDPLITYYNLEIQDNKLIDDNVDPNVQYSENRAQPILKNVGDYFFSITRFSMMGTGKSNSVPLFLPAIQTNQTKNPQLDSDMTAYILTMSVELPNGHGTFISQKPLIHIPQNELPKPSLQMKNGNYIQDVANPYYFLYTYENVVDMFNNAVNECMTDLSNLSQTNFGIENPFMSYNAESGLFSMYYDPRGFGKTPTGLYKFRIFFNTNLYGLFSSFNHKYLGGDTVQNVYTGYEDIAYEIISDRKNGLRDILINNTTYFEDKQEWISTDTLWSPISSIVFSSTMIPVINENLGQPIIYGEGNTTSSVTTQANHMPIVTDIALTLQRANDYKTFITYIPSAEFRLTELSPSTDLRNIDIKVFWKNRLDGNLYPMKLFNLSTVSVKIMFIHKSLKMKGYF